MAFDDLARHMRARDGGSMSTSTDPNLMMVEASERASASQRTSDLILGPLLLAGGLVMLVLATKVAHAGGYVGLLWVGGGASLLGGGKQLWRGLVRSARA